MIVYIYIIFCQKKTEELLTRAFPAYMTQEFEMETNETKVLPAKTSELDTIIAQTSLSIIDDYPSSDPRWAESSKGSGLFLCISCFHCRGLLISGYITKII